MAHRGAHQDLPENSLPAYQKAIDLGADFVEIDVRTTRDGRLVSIHNSTVEAYVDGVAGPVRDFTLAELKSFNLGSRYGDDAFIVRIPTVEEIFDLCRGKIGIYLDLKDGEVELLVEMIKSRGMEKGVIWYAGMQRLLQLQEMCPECIPMPDPHSPEKLSSILERFQPFVIASDMSQLSKEYVDTAHDNGAIVIVDEKEGTPEEWRRILEYGTNGIQTDRPAELIQFLKSNNY